MDLSQNERRCGRCGHEFIDHAPNWLVVPALSPCTECDCPEFVEPEQSDTADAGPDPSDSDDTEGRADA